MSEKDIQKTKQNETNILHHVEKANVYISNNNINFNNT